MISQVVDYMVRHAKNNPDGTGTFHGSPRHIMEELGMSSGPIYHRLYSLGIKRHGRGKKATCTIPKHIMR